MTGSKLLKNMKNTEKTHVKFLAMAYVPISEASGERCNLLKGILFDICINFLFININILLNIRQINKCEI